MVVHLTPPACIIQTADTCTPGQVATQAPLSIKATNLRVLSRADASTTTTASPTTESRAVPEDIKQDADMAEGMCVGTFRWKESKTLPSLPACDGNSGTGASL